MLHEATAGRYAGVAMLALGDTIIFEESVGLRLRSERLPIARNTRFSLASASKLFTAIAVAQLIEQGVLTLDDSLTKWLPEFAAKIRWPEVSIRHLLGHTSGFGTYWGEKFDEQRTTLRTVQAHFALFEDAEPSFEPGSRFEYSNVGYILLGAVIERASQTDYFEFIQKHVFDRSGMLDSGYFEADEDVPNLAVGYTYRTLPEGSRGRLPPRTNTQLKPVRGTPAGDAISTAPDLIRLCQALLAGKLVGMSTLIDLWQPLHPGPTPRGSSSLYRMCLGFMAIDGPCGRPVGHTGGFAGTTTSLFFDPQSSLIAVTLASVDGDDAAAINLAFNERWLNHDFNRPMSAA